MNDQSSTYFRIAAFPVQQSQNPHKAQSLNLQEACKSASDAANAVEACAAVLQVRGSSRHASNNNRLQTLRDSHGFQKGEDGEH